MEPVNSVLVLVLPPQPMAAHRLPLPIDPNRGRDAGYHCPRCLRASSISSCKSLTIASQIACVVVHREPVRLVRGLLNRTRAAFFVSATLAAPAVRPSPNDFLRALGIAPGMRAPARLNFAGWAELEPRRYGRMGFRFADRAVPGPFERDRDPPVSHPAHLDYVARAIEEARKSGRVLVLCTSYALVDERAKRVSSPVVHVRGARLGSCLDAFRADRRAVLLTPAAWSGVSLPGLVDHVVIPGVPLQQSPVRRRHGVAQPCFTSVARIRRYRCGGSPNSLLNQREK